MKKVLILLFVISFYTCAFANNSINGDIGRQIIDTNQSIPPNPHFACISDPVAMYTISNATIGITFDTTYYSEYTIHLVSDYFEVDYFVYTPVVYIPVATLGDIVDTLPL